MTTIHSLYESWMSSGEMSQEIANTLLENFDDFMEQELSEVETLVDADEPELAFTRMMQMTSFLNAGISKKPSIIGRLKKWVNRLKSVTHSLAKNLKADSFSISVGLPAGVSIGVSFSV